MADDKRSRDYYRARSLSSPTNRRRKIVTLDVNGEAIEYEVRAPTLAEESKINRKGLIQLRGKDGKVDFRMDQVEMSVRSVVACVFIPGTAIRVFEEADLPTLREAPIGSWISQLCTESLMIRKDDVEVEEKNSKAPISSD